MAQPHRIYLEEAGQGIPLLCLHTAGADSRQFRHVLNDPRSPSRFRVIAFDLPYHGRIDAAGRLVDDEIPAHDAVLSRNHPRGMAGARTRTAGGHGLLDGRRDRAQGRRRVSGRTRRHRRARELGLRAGPLQRVPASSRHPRRRAVRELHLRPQLAVQPGAQAGARTGGTTASPGPACIRATSTSTASTGTAARTSSASTRTAARCAAHRRIRLFLHAGDDRGGGRRRSPARASPS